MNYHIKIRDNELAKTNPSEPAVFVDLLNVEELKRAEFYCDSFDEALVTIICSLAPQQLKIRKRGTSK